MSKVSYKSVLKQALSEFDTSKLSDIKGPMLEPILSYTGEGDLETHKKTAASVLERYYFQEKEAKSIAIPDTGESVDIEQPEKDDISDGEEVKKATEKELEGESGAVEKSVIESEDLLLSENENILDDSMESRLLELEETFLADIEEEASEISEGEDAEEKVTGPGGHEPDGTGPNGGGKGPGEGKGDGSGKEAAEEEASLEERLNQLEASLEEADVPAEEGADSEAEEGAEEAAEKIAEPKEEVATESISDIESTVLEALISELEDTAEETPEEEKEETPEEEKTETPEEEKKEEEKEGEPVIDIDKDIKEGADALGPLSPTYEDVDLEEALAVLEMEMEKDEEKLDIKVENLSKDDIKI